MRDQVQKSIKKSLSGLPPLWGGLLPRKARATKFAKRRSVSTALLLLRRGRGAWVPTSVMWVLREGYPKGVTQKTSSRVWHQMQSSIRCKWRWKRSAVDRITPRLPKNQRFNSTPNSFHQKNNTEFIRQLSNTVGKSSLFQGSSSLVGKALVLWARDRRFDYVLEHIFDPSRRRNKNNRCSIWHIQCLWKKSSLTDDTDCRLQSRNLRLSRLRKVIFL